LLGALGIGFLWYYFVVEYTPKDETMDNLLTIVRQEVEKYVGSGRGINLQLFPLLDDEHQTYAVIAVDYPSRHTVAGVVIFARVAGHQVIIEEDVTNKKLVDALIQNGIARQNMILAYEGEKAQNEISFSA
jgi:predicted NBD/HSP70 family sugar kinase